MFIFNQTYTVHSVLYRSNKINCMLVKKTDDDSTLYMMNEVTAKELVIQYLDDFLNLPSGGAVDEFAQCFSDQGKLYVAFKHQDGTKLRKFLETHSLSFEEKLELAKELILGFTRYMKTPPVLQMALTQADNISIRQGSEVRFNFALSYLDETAAKPEEGDVYQSLGRLLEEVFSDVPESKRPQINIIIQKCVKNIYKQYPEIYKDLSDIKSLAESDQQRKQELERQARHWKSRLVAIGGTALMAVCITVAIYYFVFSKEVQPAMRPVESIGTLELLEQPTPPAVNDPSAPVYVDNAPTERTYDE